MAWIYLLIAGILEVIWVIGMKYSEGFTKLWPSVFTIATMIVSFYLLSMAMKVLPAGTSYSIWVGIGAVGAVIAGIALFGEAFTLARVVCLLLIVAGIVGLKLQSH